jgi:hypothetical protein
MNIVHSKHSGRAPTPESTGDPMELLDRIIGELEQARDEALSLFAVVGVNERLTLQSALKELEEKLADAKAKRDEVGQRVERTARIRALAAEMASLRDEAEAASRGDDAKAAARIKARIEEIRLEAEGMKSGRYGVKG